MKLVIGLLLTAVAGFIDAIGFLQLGGFYTSFMSGNTTQFGVGLVRAEPAAVALPLLLVVTFFLGAFAGSLVSLVTGRWCLPSVLGLVAGLLATSAFLFTATDATDGPALLLSTAMGAQNAALSQVHGTRMGVTFVTGSLFSAGHGLAKALLGEAPHAPWLLQVLVWSSLTVGAVAGTVLYGHFGRRALTIPAGLASALTLLAVARQLRPAVVR